MEILIFWFICAIVTAIIASNKGRSGFLWFLIGAMLGIFGLILVAALPRINEPKPTVAGFEAATPSTHVKCPDCAELVKKEARVCRHCGCKLTPST